LHVGTIHKVSGPAIRDGVLVLGGGRILAVGPRGAVPLPPSVPVLSLPSAHAYPGLIDAWSGAFLPPAGLGEGNAGLDITAGLERDAAAGTALLEAGITTVHVAPAASGRFAGMGAIVRPQRSGFVPFRAEPRGAVFMRLTGAAGQHRVARGKDLRDLGRPFEEAEGHAKAIAKHQEALAKYEKEWQTYLENLRKEGPAKTPASAETKDTKTSREGPPATTPADGAVSEAPGSKDSAATRKRPTFPKAPAPDPGKTALQRVSAGQQSLWIEAQRRDEILAALDLVRARNLRQVALLGVLDAGGVLDDLVRAGVPLVLAPTGLPTELDGDVIDDTLAAQLHQRGVAFAIASADARRARHLPLLAAACVGHELPADVAVRAITLTAAELLGIAGETGSLDSGKRADVLLTSAPLLASDARVLRVLADGVTLFQGR
jgi:imidazolonepropionase-like amidohydrolase